MYLIFIKENYLRDAQAMTAGKVNWDDYDAEDQAEMAYADCGGPMLVLQTACKDEIANRLKTMYPEADPEVFTVFCTETNDFVSLCDL